MRPKQIDHIFCKLFSPILLSAFALLVFQEIKLASHEKNAHVERKQKPATEVLTWEEEDADEKEKEAACDPGIPFASGTAIRSVPVICLLLSHNCIVHYMVRSVSLYLYFRNIRI